MDEKVILVNFPPALNYNYSNAGAIYPATGILLVGTIMKSRGLDIQLIDGAIKSDYEKIVLEAIDKDTIMVGFSVMTSQVPMALSLSNLIKIKYPEILIIWGGIHPILFATQTISNPNIDTVVTGEGYKTTLDLIDYLEEKRDLKTIKGIGFKDRSGKVILTEQSEPDDINNLPHLDYSLLNDTEVYLGAKSVYQREIFTDNNEKLRIIPILTGLGCCYKCQFCINVFLKRKYRFRSAISIIEEIKKLQHKYNANAFIFYDEDFLISKKRLLEFLDLIEKEDLKFYWRIWTRVNYFSENYLNRDLILRMEKNGLRSMAMGAESGSQKILDSIQKEIKVDDIRRSAEILNGTKITARYSFIVGLEGEEVEDTKKTYRVCASLLEINPKVDIAGPFIFRYYPGSPIFDRIVANYNLEMPRKIEEWERFLSNEGYLKIDKMPWLWSGFDKVVKILNKEILIFYTLRDINNFLSKLIRKLIQWRMKNLFTKFPLELYMYDLLHDFLKACYYRFLNLRRH